MSCNSHYFAKKANFFGLSSEKILKDISKCLDIIFENLICNNCVCFGENSNSLS